MRAPRLMASMPTAPVPANKSSQTEPSTLEPRTLNSVSRRRSDVGRVAIPAGAARRRLRYFPAMIRISLVSSIPNIESVPEVFRQQNHANLVGLRRTFFRGGVPHPHVVSSPAGFSAEALLHQRRRLRHQPQRGLDRAGGACGLLA